MATQPISLQGIKSHTLARIHNEQEPAKYIQSDARFSSFIKEGSIRPPVHEDFNSFLASSTLQLGQQFSEAATATASYQSHRFGPDHKTSSQKSIDISQPKTLPEKPIAILSMERIVSSATDVSKSPENLSSSATIQFPRQVIDKGYGPRTAHNPSITMASVTDVEQISIGLVNAVHEPPQHQRDNNDSQKFNESHQKAIKTSTKIDSTSRNEHAQLLRREEIEALRDVKEKFQQQLNAQHPHITVPLKHPDGIVDIHMRFDRKIIDENSPNGSVRIMFSGSNDQIVTLFAQHREEFMKIISQEGYSIDPSRMQFKGSGLPKSLAM